jgi:hypothetical protein
MRRHCDAPRTLRDAYRAIVYLNDFPEGEGGTQFFTAKHETGVVTHARTGNVVLFDMSLMHAGQAHDPKCKKYMLGFRAVA